MQERMNEQAERVLVRFEEVFGAEAAAKIRAKYDEGDNALRVTIINTACVSCMVRDKAIDDAASEGANALTNELLERLGKVGLADPWVLAVVAGLAASYVVCSVALECAGAKTDGEELLNEIEYSAWRSHRARAALGFMAAFEMGIESMSPPPGTFKNEPAAEAEAT